MESLCVAAEEGVGAILLAEEALSPPAQARLCQLLAAQEPWSDLPVVVFAAPVASAAATARAQQLVERLGNVTLVERPVRAATLVVAMRAGLRARTRQYAARALLREVAQQESQTRRRADFEQHLIGIVSHDLRNPLSAILLGTSNLLRLGGLEDRQLKGVVRVHAAADRATRMVNDLLDFTQARLGGGIRLHPRPADLHQVVRAALDEVEAANPGRTVELRCEGDGSCLVDRDRIAQVIQNLLGNALKYSPEQTPVRVSSRGDSGGLLIEVHNRGAPIPSEKLHLIFQPLRRGSSELERGDRSVGLGLFIVSHIVEAHGGSVVARSSADEGTTFTVRLPRSGASGGA